MKRRGIQPIMAILAALAVPVVAQAKSANKLLTVYSLTQKSTALGNQTVYAGGEYLRIESKRVGCKILLRPPGRTVDIVNDNKKNFFECDIAKWRDPATTVFDTKTSSNPDTFGEYLKCTPVGLSEICGLAACQYKKKESRKTDVNIWVARDIIISAAAREVLTKSLNNVVPLDRMPLRIEEETKKKRHHKVVSTKRTLLLETTSCRRASVDASVFAVPRGYTAAATEIDVLADLAPTELDGINSIIYQYTEEGKVPTKQELKNLKNNLRKNH